jgi:hypothetical protein
MTCTTRLRSGGLVAKVETPEAKEGKLAVQEGRQAEPARPARREPSEALRAPAECPGALEAVATVVEEGWGAAPGARPELAVADRLV